MTHVRFDVWYPTDAELERDERSGRREELAETLREAARECAEADSLACFHSHQLVREKCNGDYGSHLR